MNLAGQEELGGISLMTSVMKCARIFRRKTVRHEKKC